MDLDKVCRLCLSKNENVKYNIYKLIPLVMASASIQITPGDELPHGLCDLCFKKLKKSYKFRKLCERNDTFLRFEYNTRLIENSNTRKSNQVDTNSEPLQTEEINEIDSFTKLNSEDLCDASEAELAEMSPRTTEENITSDDFDAEVIVPELGNVSELRCEHCDTIFLTNEELLNHEEGHIAKHTENENKAESSTNKSHTDNLCDTCGKCFTLPENLKQHIRLHTGDFPYRCSICPKKFNQTSQLKSHIITHTKVRCFKCTLCEATYARKQGLKIHMERHHSNNVKRPLPECPICKKTFSDQYKMKQHIFIHTVPGGRFGCSFCSKRFSQKVSCRAHELLHMGRPKLFTCQYCSKSFRQNRFLQDHLKLHAEVS